MTLLFVSHNLSLERGFPLTFITLASWAWELDKSIFSPESLLLPPIYIHHRMRTHICRAGFVLSGIDKSPILGHRPPSLPPSLPPPFFHNQVTELIIFNSILLLAAVRVIRDVWGASRSCHQGLSSIIARCRLPERTSRSHRRVADGIPRWPCRAPPSLPEPPFLGAWTVPRD